MMSGALSKRQQARNERALQDLIKSVPGNNVCADCQARNPGWASWSLGIFLCMRCAALHRKLGTHITKVKSLSMDSWTSEQVENMKRVGNVASNRIFNPTNARAPIPFDADEADSAMERFIRGKYLEGAAPKVPARNNTGSTNSDDQPPPLPPKPGSRFGFRSASSIFPLSSKYRKEAAARQDFDNRARQRSPSPRRNKPSRIFGTPVGAEEVDDLELKLQRLRDMGFQDERKNTAVLKGLSGNFEKTIETLVRLGEGGNGGLKSPELPRPPFNARSRTGLTINRTRDVPSSNSSNPFDMLDTPPTAQTQSSQSTGGLASPVGNNPYQQPPNPNPFGLAPSRSQYNLSQAFQNMSVEQPPPLFPNRTGGFPSPQTPSQQQAFQQSMAPPVPSVPQQYHTPAMFENNHQQPQQSQPQQNSFNPFMQQNQPAQTPSLNTNFASNPYAQQLTTPQSLYQSPMDQPPAQQYGAAFFGSGASQLVQAQAQTNPFLNQNTPQQPQPMNPFFSQAQAPQQVEYQPQYQPQYQQQRQQTYPQMPPQTLRADKRSIMDLYNHPQMAPMPPQPILQPEQSQIQAQSQSGPQAVGQQQSPLGHPAAGTNNPFAMSGGAAALSSGDTLGQMGQFPPKKNGSRNVSRESVDASGWANGRHSPDAWGSISARAMR